MPASEVFFEVSRLSERLPALFTRVRLVTAVGSAVHGQAAGTQERFAAQTAEKLLLAKFLFGPLLFIVDKPDNKTQMKSYNRVLPLYRSVLHKVILICSLESRTPNHEPVGFKAAFSVWFYVYRAL